MKIFTKEDVSEILTLVNNELTNDETNGDQCGYLMGMLSDVVRDITSDDILFKDLKDGRGVVNSMKETKRW